MGELATPDQGRFSWRVACGLAILVLTLTVMALAQSGHDGSDPLANQIYSGGAFGYADRDGRQVLVPVDAGLARGMKGFCKAVATPGRVVPLTYAGVRRGGSGSDMAGFGDTSGAVFAAGGRVGPGGDVLVATDDFLASRRVLGLTPLQDQECPAGLRQALAARAGRPVVSCRDVATVDGGGVLALARFASEDGRERLTLAYAGSDGLVCLDDPDAADFVAPWRPDADARFPEDGLRPLFAFRTGQGLELAVRRTGGELSCMELYRQDGDVFVPYVAASWPRP